MNMSEKKSTNDTEKGHGRTSIEVGTVGVLVEDGVAYDNKNEVFQKTHDGIDYRTVGLKRAMFIIFKGMAAMCHYTRCRWLTSIPSDLQSRYSISPVHFVRLGRIGWITLNHRMESNQHM